MISSFFFFLSGVFLFGMFLLFPKTEKRISFLTWCAPAFLLLECYACAVGGVLTALTLPADKITIGIANVALGLALFLGMRAKKARQKFSLDGGNVLALVVCFLLVLAIAYIRFTPQLRIHFETSDPAIHFKLAMDSLNLHSTMGYGVFMYVGQFTNALFLSLFQPFVAAESLYHVFVLRVLMNWFMAGIMFYSCIAHCATNRLGKVLAVGCMLVYVCGYPLTDLLFGFVYLGQTLNFILLLVFLTEALLTEELSLNMAVPAFSVVCLAVSLGYILFAPLVYVALFIRLTVYYCRKKGNLFSWHYIRMQLSTFLFPSVLTLLYYFVLIKRYDQSASMSSLAVDGYVYRNFYSDFILFIPLALWGIVQLWKKSKDRFVFYLAVLTAAFMAGMLVLVASGLISGYYYYKMNFLLWLVLLLAASRGLLELEKISRSFATCLSLSFCILFALFIGKAEIHLYEHGVQVTPQEYTMSETWFRNYSYNRDWLYSDSLYEDSKIQIYQQMDFEVGEDVEASKSMLFMGDWLDLYWCQAISGGRKAETAVPADTNAGQIVEERLAEMEKGEYVVLLKDYFSDPAVLESVQSLLDEQTTLLFSNEAGWVYEVC